MKILFFFLFLFFSSIVSSSSETITTLTPVSFYPTSVSGPRSCVKSSDESFAICASEQRRVIRFNLQPFSFALASADAGSNLQSCDLYEEVGNPSASSVVCAKGNGVNFYNASTLSYLGNISVTLGPNAQVIVDKSNATSPTPPLPPSSSEFSTSTPQLLTSLQHSTRSAPEALLPPPSSLSMISSTFTCARTQGASLVSTKRPSRGSRPQALLPAKMLRLIKIITFATMRTSFTI
jgi:hypothetical protein